MQSYKSTERLSCDGRGELDKMLGVEHEDIGRRACQRVIDLCKKLVYSEQFVDDCGWRGVSWHKWCEGIDGALTDVCFGELPLARGYLWGRRKFCRDDVPLHAMAMRGEEDLVVLGILLALHRSWFDLVGCLGSLLHAIVKSPCSNILVEFARSKGCDPRIVDDQGSTPFHAAAQLGRYKTIRSLSSLIRLADCCHPAFEISTGMAHERGNLDTMFNRQGLLPIHCVFLNGEISRQDLVQTLHTLRDLGADLTICDRKNKYTLTNFCIARTSTHLNYLLDNLVFGISRQQE